MCWLLFNERFYKRCKLAFWNRYLAWRGYSLIRLRTTLLVSNFCFVVLRDAGYYMIHSKRHFRYSIVFIDKIMNVEILLNVCLQTFVSTEFDMLKCYAWSVSCETSIVHKYIIITHSDISAIYLYFSSQSDKSSCVDVIWEKSEVGKRVIQIPPPPILAFHFNFQGSTKTNGISRVRMRTSVTFCIYETFPSPNLIRR